MVQAFYGRNVGHLR